MAGDFWRQPAVVSAEHAAIPLDGRWPHFPLGDGASKAIAHMTH